MERDFFIIIWGYADESSREVKFRRNGHFSNTSEVGMMRIFESRFCLTVDIWGFPLRNK